MCTTWKKNGSDIALSSRAKRGTSQNVERLRFSDENAATHFSYTWRPDGEDQQGIFHIVLQIPCRRIAWRTMANDFMSGVVSFEPRSQEETEVTLKIRSIFDPPSLSQRVEEYLRNFKQLVENGEAASVCS